MSIADRLAELDQVGIHQDGVFRMAWSAEDRACRRWFERQAAQAGLAVARDPAGNLWAHPDCPPPWWAVGSHLDSVRGGGRLDGPLGVAAGFEIAASSRVPVAVLSFADEEGARFNTPTFGSKALVGALELPAVLRRRDDDGISVEAALASAGIEPSAVGEARQWLAKLAGFIEIHIDQSTAVAEAGVPVGIVSSLASRTRLEVELRGQADHAGTTPVRQRHDALAAAAHLILASQGLADDFDGLVATSSRITVEPNAATTIAARVRLWIDARAPAIEALEGWQRALGQAAEEIASRSRVEITISTSSRSFGQAFDPDLREHLLRAAEDVVARPIPELICFAGHDAGVLAARVPAAMILVRNPTGISHSPAEEVDLDDAERAVRIVVRALPAVAARAMAAAPGAEAPSRLKN